MRCRTTARAAWRTESHKATNPSTTGGVIHAVLTVRLKGALLERSRVNLTSDRERSRFIGLLKARGEEIEDRLLLGIEESIRETGVPGERESNETAGSAIALEDPEPWHEPPWTGPTY